ncbi:WD domain, G-beta repeat [Plasmodiophora brassicae]
MAASVVLATAGYGSIKLWQATSAQCRQSIPHPDSQVNRLDITADKQILAAAGNPSVRLYDIPTLNQNQSHIRCLNGHKANVMAIGFQKESKWMFSASEDGMIKIWDIRAGTCQKDLSNGSPVNDAALHPNQGEIVAVDEAGHVRIYDLTAGKLSTTLVPEDKSSLRSVSVASDASVIAAANTNGKFTTWSLAGEPQPRILQTVSAHNTYLLKCLISPDVRYLATTSADRTVKIWNLADNCELSQTLTGHKAWVWDCSFSADSAYLVTASSDKTARLWDLSSGDAVLEYQGHQKPATCVALNDSPNAT